MTDTLLDAVRTRMTPYGKFLGLEITEAALDRVVGRVKVRAELCTFPEILHGGALMSVADNLGAIATVLNLPPGAWTTTIESKTNFVAAAPIGQWITGVCTPIHKGKTTMVWQTRLTREDERLVALVTQTQLVIAGR